MSSDKPHLEMSPTHLQSTQNQNLTLNYSVVESDRIQEINLPETNDRIEELETKKGEEIQNALYSSGLTSASLTTDKSKIDQRIQNLHNIEDIFGRDISGSLESFANPQKGEHYKKAYDTITSITLSDSFRSSFLSDDGPRRNNDKEGKSTCSGCTII